MIKTVTGKLLANGIFFGTILLNLMSATIITTTYLLIAVVVDWVEKHL